MDWNTLRFLQDLERRSGWTYRENGPSLTAEPMSVPSKAQPIVETRTPGDAVPMAKLDPAAEANVKLDANADIPTRVAAVAVKNAETMDAKIEAFAGSVAKVAGIDAAELRAAQKAAADALKKAKDPEAKAAAQQKFDELTGVTLPNGSRIEFGEMLPYVDDTGVERQMSALDFLREMQKDADALQSVMTCARPS
jgi:hypothetical protein